MAGDWIKWQKGLVRKMEILQIANRLHISPYHAAGVLMQLMEWVDENVSRFDHNGNALVTLGPLQSTSLDVTLGLPGFMETLAEVGWLRVKNDVLIFVHVGRHNGETAKKRALASNRIRKFRAGGDVTGKALPEKRREEKSIDKRVAADKPPPAPADDSAFLSTLKANPAYQGIDIDRERGKAESWCLANRRVCSRRFFVNWLNKCERPMGSGQRPRPEIPPEPVNWRGLIGDHFPDSIYLEDKRDWAHLPEYTRKMILESLKKIPV